MTKFNQDSDNRGNRIEESSAKAQADFQAEADEELEGLEGAPEPLPENLTIRISKALHRKLRDYAREEGVSIDELISELLAEGVVLRAFEIVERKQTMRGGNNQPHRNQQNGNVNGNVAHGNTQQGNQQHRNQFQQGGNRQAQKKLQRQARQHANAMDLLQDKAAFLEYVRNQEKKRR
jgi:predicted HicB family RNase H-like nuclease